MLEKAKGASIEIIIGIVAAVALVYCLVYQAFLTDYAAYEYNTTFYSAYHYVSAPLAWGAASFLLSRRFLRVLLGKRALGIVRLVCLIAVLAYVVCLVVAVLYGAGMSLQARLCMFYFTEAFISIVPIPFGVALGSRQEAVGE